MGQAQTLGQLTGLTPITTERPCSLDASALLPHSKSKTATHAARKPTGTKVLLCSSCATYAKAHAWGARQGLHLESVAGLLALSLVFGAECGYRLPSLRHSTIPPKTMGNVAFWLRKLCRAGAVYRSGDLDLLRDACPACYRRGGCAKECGMHFEPEHFAMRRESYVTG